MGIATKFKVTLDDGREIEGRMLPVDMVAAERHFGGVDKRAVEAEFFSVFNALKRKGEELGSFDDFMSRLEDYQSDRTESGNGQAPLGATESPSSPTAPASRRKT